MDVEIRLSTACLHTEPSPSFSASRETVDDCDCTSNMHFFCETGTYRPKLLDE